MVGSRSAGIPHADRRRNVRAIPALLSDDGQREAGPTMTASSSTTDRFGAGAENPSRPRRVRSGSRRRARAALCAFDVHHDPLPAGGSCIALDRSLSMDLLRILLAILLPPVGVFLQVGFGLQFWINILLTLLGYIPGIVHAIWIIARR
jgi:uncharacterized membrane protein YqaE (UPF0057 family)